MVGDLVECNGGGGDEDEHYGSGKGGKVCSKMSRRGAGRPSTSTRIGFSSW